MNTLKLQPRAQQIMHQNNPLATDVAPEITDRACYSDLIAAQVKTVSFLAYIIRTHPNLIAAHKHNVPEYVIQLFQNCPSEAAATRKELLVATRHILSTDMRSLFVAKIDMLLNESVLLGNGITSHQTLRPLAFSMLADLLHHVRKDLSLAQITRTVHLYVRNLHDQTLPINVQIMSAKLLLNLIECIRTQDPGNRLFYCYFFF